MGSPLAGKLVVLGLATRDGHGPDGRQGRAGESLLDRRNNVRNIFKITLLFIASALLVSCIDAARLVEEHDVEYVPRGSGAITNTILSESEKVLLLAALSNATVRSYAPCDCFPSCSFVIRGTEHTLNLHGTSILKLDTTKEYLCAPEGIQRLLKLIRSNQASQTIGTEVTARAMR